MATHSFKRVLVWELPVRISHWINVLTILVLCVTGYLIGNPPVFMSGAEASDQYWFGVNRFIHFAAAYIFLFNLLFRVYWSFVGNKYAHWKSFFPLAKEGIKNVLHVLKVDIFLNNPKVYKFTDISVGHNALAGLSYFAFFGLALIQVFTGFALYADMSGWWFPKMFDWVVPLFGGDFAVRMIHHVVMWLIILFTIIHIYLVFYHEWLEGRGEVSSMFSGYKFVRSERVKDPEANKETVP